MAGFPSAAAAGEELDFSFIVPDWAGQVGDLDRDQDGFADTLERDVAQNLAPMYTFEASPGCPIDPRGRPAQRRRARSLRCRGGRRVPFALDPAPALVLFDIRSPSWLWFLRKLHVPGRLLCVCAYPLEITPEVSCSRMRAPVESGVAVRSGERDDMEVLSREGRMSQLRSGGSRSVADDSQLTRLPWRSRAGG